MVRYRSAAVGGRPWGAWGVLGVLVVVSVFSAAADARPTGELNKLADSFYRLAERRHYRPRLDAKGNRAWLRNLDRVEQKLDRIPTARLNQQGRITHGMLKTDLANRRQYINKGWIKEDLNGIDSLLHTLTNPLDRPRRTVKDWRWTIRTIRHSAPFVDGYIGLLKQGIREKRTRPEGAVKSAIECLGSLTSRSARTNPYLALEGELNRQLAGNRALPALRRELRQAVQQQMLPSSRKLRRFLQRTYLPRASRLGTNRGRYLYHLSQHLGAGHPSPEQLGRWGRREVKRLLGELQKTARQIDPKARSLAGFMRRFNGRKSNHYSSGDALLLDARARLRDAKQKARQLAPIPRSRITIGRVPRYLEGTTTAQYVTDSKREQPTGQMQVNTGRLLSDQLRSGMDTLLTHEIFGGHHLAYVYAKKQKGLPRYRREANNTAYDEGWALYSEQWRHDHKGFSPSSRVGYITDQLWRAARLVVDTGLHTGTMTPTQAERYFRDATFTGKAAAKTEIQRYIDWPGQAVAYYYGKDHILKTRDQVKRILAGKGAKPRKAASQGKANANTARAQTTRRTRATRGFDARRFHAKLLSLGPVPLEQARSIMVSWAHRRAAQLGRNSAPRRTRASPRTTARRAKRHTSRRSAPSRRH